MPTQAAAQVIRPRSVDYLFVSQATDSRALWVNPAGLAATAEASVYGELMFERPESDIRVAQWGFGLNSRGFSFGYLRDRLVGGITNSAYRFSLARAFTGGSAGLSLTFYKGGSTKRGLDLGVRYTVLPSVTFAAVLRNIGQPRVRTEQTPFTGVAGLDWSGLTKNSVLMGELQAANRIGDSGYDVSYRTGLRIGVGRSVPITALVSLNLESDLGVDRWTVGLSIGGNRKAVAAATVVPSANAADFRQLSITGVANDRLGRSRR